MNTEITNKSTEAKHVLCEVAVLYNYPHLCKKYVSDLKKENENITLIRSIEDCKGRFFNKVVYTVNWFDMDDFYEVEKEVLSRVRSDLT